MAYHHGDLPSALRTAAAELVAERGPTGFSLREVARRAGVSHAAPAHHFGDSRGLLTSVATEGFETLSDAYDVAIDGVTDPAEQLCALGKAYVDMAVHSPGHFGVMCENDLVDAEDPDLLKASIGTYKRLLTVVERIRDESNPDLDVDTAATLTWSIVHGLAVLAPGLDLVAKKTGTRFSPLDQLVEQFTVLVMDGLRAR
jgi:AcrR family transcriptional regulator